MASFEVKYSTFVVRPSINGSLLFSSSVLFFPLLFNRAPESLFDPNLVGIDRPGLHKSIFECVSKCPIDYRTELYSKIVLSGGSTLFPGKERDRGREKQKN